jgi:hypothetical protein
VTHSNSTGEYRFDNLPVGTYRITVKAAGFRTFVEQADVVLNKTGTRNASMIPGAASETVEVSGAAPAIDTTTAQLQSTFDPQYSQDLGLTSAGGAGAGVLNLSLLTPGVTNGSSMGDGVGPSVGGQRPRDNNFTVEGVDNNKTVTGSLITVPPRKPWRTLPAFHQFNSEFGHSSGGNSIRLSKPERTAFAGSAYEYFRNRNLNAVDQTWVQQGLTTNPRFDANRSAARWAGQSSRTSSSSSRTLSASRRLHLSRQWSGADSNCRLVSQR